jgi:hypothetical protein
MAQESGNNRIGGIDEKLLNAYVDGELGTEQSAELAGRLDQDPVAASYVRNVRRVDSLARAAMCRIDDQQLSAGLSASLETLRRQGTQAKNDPWHRPYLAVAASLLVLTIGYGAGFLSAEYNFDRQMLAMEQARSQSLEEVKVALNHALEYSPSGTPVSWQSENGRASAELLPIRTLQTADKLYCREFKEVLVIDGVREERRGLSCREGKEDWQTRVVLAEGAPELL